MKKIVKYRLRTRSIEEFAEDVEADIKKGWQPFGGVSLVIGPSSMTFYYTQAMVKYEE